MEADIQRGVTSGSIRVDFDDLDVGLAFPCNSHNSELWYQFTRDCERPISEELMIRSQVAKLIEDAQVADQAADLNLTAQPPVTDPEL